MVGHEEGKGLVGAFVADSSAVRGARRSHGTAGGAAFQRDAPAADRPASVGCPRAAALDLSLIHIYLLYLC